MDLQNTINEVHRKVGRNLILIQKLEYQLKHIVLYSSFSGKLSNLKDTQNSRKETISKMSMGQVLFQYLNHINPSIENNQKTQNYENDIYISKEIDFNFTKEQYEKNENLLSDILKERNDLVHHLILDYNEKSIDSLKNIEHKLDEQKKRLLFVLEDLKTTIQMMEKVFNSEFTQPNFIQKAYYYNDLLFFHKSLILELANLSMQNDGADGWISLSSAGKHIRNTMPEEVDQLKDKYGYKTLKPLIQDTEMFEIKEDTNKNMFFYRLTVDWKKHLNKIIHS